MKVGVLGGGQLAAMMAEAGMPMGMDFVFLDPSPQACAGRHGSLLVADWADAPEQPALRACDRLTCDFENVPAEVLEALADGGMVRPGPKAFAAAQDRLVEKQLLERLGIPVAPFQAVGTRPDLLEALDRIGYPAVLKTRRLGYDGKGQAILNSSEDLEPAWAELGGQELVLEAWVDFRHECAITAVRSASGEICYYPPSWTLHSGGILRLAIGPGALAEGLTAQAEDMVARLLEELDYIGCLTLELFVGSEGLLANEFAPRVHNSAHWTIEGAWTSQFENHLRAICDLPLGRCDSRGLSLMLNWIGELPDRDRLLSVPGLHWHDYRKAVRPGRKVGHATVIAAGGSDLQAAIAQLRECLAPQWLPWLAKAEASLT
jgi:5-(carboxyamino)imidazole ribonucleotide synthase